MKNAVPEPLDLDDDMDEDLDDYDEPEEERPVYAPWSASSVTDRAYWQAVPHPFVPARWGLAYCLLCSATATGEGVEHLDEVNLPFAHPWRLGAHERPSPGHRPSFRWHVDAWSDDGATCSYEVDTDKDAAFARAARYAEHGDETGRRYDHYAVTETVYTVLVTSYAHPLPGRESELGSTNADRPDTDGA